MRPDAGGGADRNKSERIALVTGATSGIGFATAAALARAGMRVVMVCRNPDRGEASRAAIHRDTGSNRLELLQADLSSRESVRALAARFLATHERLDVLVNDAGVLERRRRTSVDGIEMTLAVNLLAPFLLSSLLLDRLRHSAPARIVNVCSAMQARASLDLTDLQFARRRYSMTRAYSQSKLGLLLATKELARHLAGSGVTVNAAHPGWVATNLGNHGGVVELVWRLSRPFMISPEEGARTSVYLALSSDVAGVSGGYFAKQAPAPVNPLAEDRGLAASLWEVLESMSGAKVLAA